MRHFPTDEARVTKLGLPSGVPTRDTYPRDIEAMLIGLGETGRQFLASMGLMVLACKQC